MLVKAELASKADKVKLGKEEVNEVTYINYASRTTIMKKGGGIQRGRQNCIQREKGCQKSPKLCVLNG